MKTRLIIVEGLPGTGKSTLSERLAAILKAEGIRTLFKDEGDPDHPADLPDYGFEDFQSERTAILNRWKQFANEADQDTVHVFNCIFLQNPMSETMMRFDLSPEQSETYIREIAEIIQPLDPVIFYLDEPDVKKTLENVLDERGQDWLNSVIEYHTAQGWGKRQHLSGISGYISCLEERKRRELKILENLPVRSYRISRKDEPARLAKRILHKTLPEDSE